MDLISNPDATSVLQQVDVLAKRAVSVADEHIIGVGIEAGISSSLVRIILYPYDGSCAGRMNESSQRHLPIDGKFIRASMAIFAVKALADAESLAGSIGQ